MSPEKNNRIAVFSLAYHPLEGGAEVATREILSRLPDKRFFIFTKKFNSAWPRKESFGNSEIIRIGRGKETVDYYGRPLSKFFFIFRAYLAANREHRKKKFEAIWAIMASYSGLAALLFKLRHPSVPFLLTLQEGDSEEYIMDRVGIFYSFWRMIFKRADFISAISNYLADFARRHGARCPIEVAPNGVDLTKYNANDANQNANDAKISRHSHKLSQNSHYVIITTSRLVYKNGVDILIRAIAELKNNPIPHTPYPIPHTLIAGGGPEEKSLRELAKRLGLEDKIEFLGQIPANKIPEYLSRADIFVRASRSEGLGSSFLEAMAAGLPVIGTPVGGITDFLKEYNANDAKLYANDANGLYAKVDDPKDLAEKISLLMNSDDLRKRLGGNGRVLVLENYSWDSIALKMEKIFESLVISPRSRTPKYNKLTTGQASSLRGRHKSSVIVFAAGIYPPDVGGPATHAKELAERFKEKGIKVKVVTYGEQSGAVSRKLPRQLRYSLYFWKVFKAARSADLIYAQDATATGLPSLLVSKILRKPLYLRIGGDVLWERAVERGERFLSLKEYYSQGFHLKDRQKMFQSIKKVFKSAKAIVVTTPLLKDIYVRFYDLPPEKIKVILNPFPKMQPASVKESSQTILFAGRFVAYKNLELLMRSFDKVWRKTGKGELVLIGDGPEKKNLEKLREKLSSRERIRILPKMTQDKVFENISAARLCVGPALTEFNPNFILECLSLNTPALISRENGLTVQLPPNFEFDPKENQDLESKLERFFDESFYKKANEMIAEIEIKQSWEDAAEAHREFFGF